MVALQRALRVLQLRRGYVHGYRIVDGAAFALYMSPAPSVTVFPGHFTLREVAVLAHSWVDQAELPQLPLLDVDPIVSIVRGWHLRADERGVVAVDPNAFAVVSPAWIDTKVIRVRATARARVLSGRAGRAD